MTVFFLDILTLASNFLRNINWQPQLQSWNGIITIYAVQAYSYTTHMIFVC